MRSVNRSRAAEDGLGWWWDYVTRLVKTYPSFSRDFVMDELAMSEGWCWYAAAIEMDGWLAFCGVKRASAGFVKQQVEQLVAQAHEVWKQQ